MALEKSLLDPIESLSPHSESRSLTVEEERSDIDARLAWHYSQLTILKPRHNSMIPILHLPNELMTRIFALYVVDPYQDQLFSLKWTKLMLVCRIWHQVALAAQPLWGYISIGFSGRPHRTATQLKRSGACPIYVKIGAYDSNPDVDVVLSEARRIASLEVNGFANDAYNIVHCKLSPHQFPILRELCLDPHYGRKDLPPDIFQAMTDSTFQGRFPVLRDLSLTSIGFPWRLVANLNTFSLSDYSNSGTLAPPTFVELLSVLRESPKLTALRLESVFPSDLSERLHSPVDLASLTSLYLKDDAATCTAVLRHLRLPSTTKIEITLADVHTGAEVGDLDTVIREHLHGRTIPQLRMSFWASSHDPLTWELIIFFVSQSSFDRMDSPFFSLSCHTSAEDALPGILAKVIAGLRDPTCLTHFNVSYATLTEEESWKNVLALLPGLHALHVDVHPGSIDLFHALHYIEVKHLDRTAPDTRTFPEISRLHVHVPAFRDSVSIIPATFSALGEYIRFRNGNGNSLEVLEMDDDWGRFLLKYTNDVEKVWELVKEGTGRMTVNRAPFDPVQAREERERVAPKKEIFWEDE